MVRKSAPTQAGGSCSANETRGGVVLSQFIANSFANFSGSWPFSQSCCSCACSSSSQRPKAKPEEFCRDAAKFPFDAKAPCCLGEVCSRASTSKPSGEDFCTSTHRT